jgi:O-acetyl-ADP-ribose deacetylase (regulator of RNase III)
MEVRVQGRRLALRRGDITTATVDAIVNAANARLAGGGGVDGAIHCAGGPEIMAECRRLGGCATGDAVATGAGRLGARHVIHAVAPVWRGGRSGEASHLRSAYRRTLALAAELGDRTIAFPSLGTGAYGYPVEPASKIALTAILDFLEAHSSVDDVTFYLFTDQDLDAYTRTLRRLTAR